VNLGDFYDFPDIRPGHRVYPEHNAKVTECLQAGYDVQRGIIEASPDTEWEMLLGNHDTRFYNIGLDQTPNLSDARRPVTWEGEGGEPIPDLAHAGRLDELGVKVVYNQGHYENDQINLSQHLAVRHGWVTRKTAGSSAQATLDSLRYSIMIGHTHRQSLVYHTTRDIDGQTTTLQAAEIGCMCRLSQIPDEQGRVFPNYVTNPDWQQGFMTAVIWPDGKFALTPAIFVNNTLLWRDQRYEI
jgi:hypothetical protein